jgi:predicted XRE-type DNA-binding protein
MPGSSTKRKGAIKHEQSSGNVFSDVGLPEDYLAKADLVATIDQIISERELTQTEAAALLGIDQPRVSAMLRGKLDLFSLDKLISFVGRLGNAVEIRISKRQPEGSGLTVVSMLSNRRSIPQKRTQGRRG